MGALYIALKYLVFYEKPYVAQTQWNQLTPLAEALFVECPILKMAKWLYAMQRLVLWEQNEDLSV